MLDSLELIQELVAAPGPPGQEGAVREVVEAHVRALGYDCRTDAKGNLIVPLPGGDADRPRVVITAHLDEIALMVTDLQPDGRLRVASLGGLMPWKWGEQPVEILASGGPISGVVCFGCIHTSHPAATTQQARVGPLLWEQARIFTGMRCSELAARGVRPGTRVVLARERRTVRAMGDFVVSYFLDDRADLAVWLLALEAMRGQSLDAGVVFAATAAEEVGGEGASFLLNRIQPDVCVALEIGPTVPESPFMPDSQPTIWVTDGYATAAAADLDMLAALCDELDLDPHWQPLSRGGSDASCAASRGLTARPITLGLSVENSHGLEIMHRSAPRELTRLLVELLRRECDGEEVA